VEVLQAAVLGVVQGFTEFLPISSSGHLRLVHDSLGWSDFGLAFDTLLHVATLLAVGVYFRTDLRHMALAMFSRDPARARDRRLARLVILATIPTGVIGLAGSDFFESASMLLVGIAFLVTAASLTAADLLSRKSLHEASALGPWRAVLVGIAQGVAVMPGISRAGATMAAGLGLGLDREQAARFSFLLSFPIILLAGAKQTLELLGGTEPIPGLLATIVGVLAAAVTGYLAIAYLMSYLRHHTFQIFAIYTALLGTAVITWQLMG
jgi:undecaprenyl-diphosphatase